MGYAMAFDDFVNSVFRKASPFYELANLLDNHNALS